MEQDKLTSLVDRMEATLDGGDRVSLGELLDALGQQGFGPVLLFGAFGMILPLGMVPMMPLFFGLLLFSAGWQLVRGHRGFRMPGWLARRTVPSGVVQRSIGRLHPWAEKAGRASGAHWADLAEKRWVRLGGALTTMLSAGIILALGFIPGLPAAMSVPVALFALGLTLNNGALAVASLAVLPPAIALTVWLMPWPPWSPIVDAVARWTG
jgi:hypothetical protein